MISFGWTNIHWSWCFIYSFHILKPFWVLLCQGVHNYMIIKFVDEVSKYKMNVPPRICGKISYSPAGTICVIYRPAAVYGRNDRICSSGAKTHLLGDFLCPREFLFCHESKKQCFCPNHLNRLNWWIHSNWLNQLN